MAELKSFGAPPSAVLMVMGAVMVLIEGRKGKVPKDRSWTKVKAMMAKVDQFLDSLVNYDKENIHPNILKAIEDYLSNPEFDPDIVRSKSGPAAVLCSWVINIVRFYKVFCDVAPKQMVLEEANSQLKDGQDRLTGIIASVKQHKDTSHHAHSETSLAARKQSSASMTSLKSTDQERRGSFRATETISKGGFLAPTKAWLSLRGDMNSLSSLSPRSLSPGSKERSLSPRRRLRENSADSDTNSRKSVTFGVRERKAADKDPGLPSVRRSSSLRGAGDMARRVRPAKASVDNLTQQNGSAEETVKVKRRAVVKRSESRSLRSREASKENVEQSLKAVNASSEKITSREASREIGGIKSVDAKPGVKSVLKSRDSSKDNSSTKSSLSREGSMRRRSVAKEAVKEINNGGKKTASTSEAPAEMSSVDATKPPASPPAAVSNGLIEVPPASTKLSMAAKLETQLRAEEKAAKAKAEAEAEAKVKAANAEAEIAKGESTVIQMASKTVAASTTSTVTGKVLIDRLKT